MHPEPEREKRRRDQGQYQRQVSENRPAGEGRNYRRDDARRRQEDDVNLGMAKEPEKVLPEENVAAFGWVEEMRGDETVGDQRRARQHDRRHREYNHEGRYELRPHKQRD